MGTERTNGKAPPCRLWYCRSYCRSGSVKTSMAIRIPSRRLRKSSARLAPCFVGENDGKEGFIVTYSGYLLHGAKFAAIVPLKIYGCASTPCYAIFRHAYRRNGSRSAFLSFLFNCTLCIQYLITRLCATRSVLKGPKVVRLKSHATRVARKEKTHRKGVFSFSGCGSGI